MAEQLDHILASRMNEEPSILRGCSSTELLLVAGSAVAFWLPVAIILAFLVGAVAIGFAGIMIVGTVYVGGGLFQKLKRGRPDGYYQQRVDFFLSRLGLRRSRFVSFEVSRLGLGRTWRP